MVCAMSTEITFCVSRSCESAVIEDAPTSTNVATANTRKRTWDIEISSKHQRCDESRILQASPKASQRGFVTFAQIDRVNVAARQLLLAFSPMQLDIS